MGNGVTTEFAFNFPYFENSNIIVTKNDETATGYSVVGTPAGLDADIPYTGGKVVFETAPTSLDNIIIARSLPLERIVDYQPLAKLEPTTLNQDANYLMEVIKDLQDELDTLESQYSDIADKESTATLLAQIAAIHDEIVTVAAQITALGDISTLRQTVTTNGENITALQTSVTNIIQNPVYSIPDYAATPTALSTATDTWISITQTGVLHVKIATTNAISWLTIYIGNEDNNIALTTQVNTEARGANVLYHVKSGQKIKLAPRNSTITTCEIIPFCS